MKYLIIVPVVFFAVVALLTFLLVPDDLTGCPDAPTQTGRCQKADAIVAISGGDTAARTAAAVELYKNGWADSLIFSGAAQDKTGPSNAAVMRTFAVAQGVPSEAIFTDEISNTTEENALNTQAILERRSIDSLILVTSGYHQRRANLAFEKYAGDVTIINRPTDDRDWSLWWWVSPRGWWLVGGEIAKIMVFYAQGVMR